MSPRPAAPAAEPNRTGCRCRRLEKPSDAADERVPLGMFLSGGVDSSAMAGLMKRMVDTPQDLLRWPQRGAAVSRVARDVAAHMARPYEVQVGMTGFFNALPSWYTRRAHYLASSVSLYFVSKLASNHEGVLTGEGSDELFAGYARYRFYAMNRRWAGMYGHLPGSLREAVRGQIASSPLLGASLRRKLGHTFLGRGESIDSLYLDNFYSAFPESDQHRLFPNLGDASPYSNYRRYWQSEPQRPFLDQLLYADQKTYLVELLMKQDQMSMAASIESRVPSSTIRLSSSRRTTACLLHGRTANTFSKAVEDLLPLSIVHRKKMGSTPLRQWLLILAPGPGPARSPDGILLVLRSRRVARPIARHRRARKTPPTESGACSASDLGRRVPHRPA